MRSYRTATWRNWLQRTFRHTAIQGEALAPSRRVRSRWFRPSLERLEDRVLPSIGIDPSKINVQEFDPINGHVIQHVHVVPIFYGSAWNDTYAGHNLLADVADNLRNELNFLVHGTYFTGALTQTDGFIGGLGQYGVETGDVYGINAAGLETAPLIVINTQIGANGVTDTDIQNLIKSLQGNPNTAFTPSTLYVVCTPPDVPVYDASKNLQNPLPNGGPYESPGGYHQGGLSSDGNITNNYAVIPFARFDNSADAVQFFEQGVDGIMSTVSHELVEAVTDPVRDGWQEVSGLKDPTKPWTGVFGLDNEIGDLAEINNPTAQVNEPLKYNENGTLFDPNGHFGYTVQKYWSNANGGVMLPPQAGTLSLGESIGASANTLQVTDIEAPTEGTFSGLVGTFADGINSNTDPSQYATTIDWGDGSSSSGAVSYNSTTGNSTTGLFEVRGSHVYSLFAGTQVDVAINLTGPNSAAAQDFAQVALQDAPLSATATNPTTSVFANSPLTLAQLVDNGNFNGSTTPYSGTISWDNGPASNGITFQPTGNSTFDIVSSPSFDESGTHTYHIVINDSGGASTTVDGTLVVNPAGLIPDPSDPTKSDLVVGGTNAGNETILKQGANPGDVDVIVNGKDQGSFSPTGQILVKGYSGPDQLTIDFSNGNFIPSGGLSFDGSTGDNGTLILKGNLPSGKFNSEIYTASGSGAGTINLDGSTITFSNLRPIDDTVAATTYSINGTAASELINIVDHIGLVNGFQATQVNSGSNPTFELVNFANKGTVFVNGVGGSDTFTLDNPNPAAGLTSLILVGSDAGNTFNVQALAVPTIIDTGNGKNSINLHDSNNSMTGITASLTLNSQKSLDTTLNAANDDSFTLTDTSLVSGPVSVTLEFASGSFPTVNLTGGPGATPRVFDVSGWHNASGSAGDSLDAQGGDYTVVDENNPNNPYYFDLELTDSLLTDSNVGVVYDQYFNLEGIKKANLSGVLSSNEFTVHSWSGEATLNGKAGDNLYSYVTGNGGTVHIIDSAGTGANTAAIFGTDSVFGSGSADTFDITPSQVTDGLDTVSYDTMLQKLEVFGGNANEVFNVTPSTTTTFTLDGGAPPPPTSPGDTLNLDLTGAIGSFRTATPTASGYQGTWTFANRMPVSFIHMETLTPAVTLSGAGVAVNGFEYSALDGVLAANFTNAHFLVPASDFVASIDWGDNTVSAGTVTLSGGTYLIRGSHTYTDEGAYTVTVRVSGDLTSAVFSTSATMLEELLPDGSRGTPNQRFVSELYRDLLQRPVDQASLDTWTNWLNLGVPQVLVVLGIESTPEFRQLQVEQLYQTYLHRQPNSFELSMGTAFLLSGGSPEQFAMFLVSTPEFFFQQGGGSLLGFLNAFYLDALQSPIPSSDQTADLMAVAQGTSLTDIVQQVLHDPVYLQGVVNDDILMLLDRNPYGSDAANLAAGLEMGLTDDQVVALLATSTPYQEFFNKTAS